LKNTIHLIILIIIISLLCSCSFNETSTEETNSTVEPASSTVMLTFQEGYNIRQYAAILEEGGVCSAEDFYAAVNEVNYSEEYGFLPEFSSLSDRQYKLEGYLYPDTYEFYTNGNAEDVVRKMLDNFRNKISDVYNSVPKNSGLTFDECLILASIVEKESGVEAERNKIAGVFINRLNASGNLSYLRYLQSDATWYYPYTSADVPKDFKSEYNTYKFEGLPKGPICNPSVSAIKATINPDTSHGAYYFYTDKNNVHYYAQTYEKHRENIQYCKDNNLAP